ncbi:MAG: NAD(P)-dependent alcohol dehydrogenase [Sandaracinaceae bacterium]
MKAVVQRRYGPADEVLEVGELERPGLGEDDVLVEVVASAIHPDIWHMVTGLPYVMRLMGGGLLRPKHPVPGTDLAGRVVEVGSRVTRFAPGDEVFGEVVLGFQWQNGGTYAEYAAVPERALAHKPEGLTFEEAAAVPTTGLIAERCLRVEARLEAGQHILINGAGGGVGTFAVQIAKARGAEVTAVDHASKLTMLRSIGADHVIDFEAEDVTQGDARYDAILDVASTLPLDGAKRILAPDGVYVRVGHEHYEERRRRVFGSLPSMFALLARSPFDPHLPKVDFTVDVEEGLRHLVRLIDDGKLTPVVDRAFRLDEVRDAIRYLKQGGVQGRAVLRIGSAGER